MYTTTAPVRKSYPAARCTCTMTRKPIYPCELIPTGKPGEVLLNGETYSLEVFTSGEDYGNPTIEGYRFSKPGSEPRDVRCEAGRLSCDCPDHLFRRRRCKHIQGVEILRTSGKLI